jgi:hypothetical protein
MLVQTNAHGAKTVVQTAYFIPSTGSDVILFEPNRLPELADSNHSSVTLTSGHRVLWHINSVSEDFLERLKTHYGESLPVFDDVFIPVPADKDPRGIRVPSQPGERFWAIVLEEDVPGHTFGIWANGLLVESTGADRIHGDAFTTNAELQNWTSLAALGGKPRPPPPPPSTDPTPYKFFVTGPSTITLDVTPITVLFNITDTLSTNEGGGWYWTITHSSGTSWTSRPETVDKTFSWSLDPSYPFGEYTLQVTENSSVFVVGTQATTTLNFQVQTGGACIGDGACVLMAL